jgi:hypothetical protein
MHLHVIEGIINIWHLMLRHVNAVINSNSDKIGNDTFTVRAFDGLLSVNTGMYIGSFIPL